MTQRTISRMFETAPSAHAAVIGLEDAGFPATDITYMGNTPIGELDGTMPSAVAGNHSANDPGDDTAAAAGASLGTVVGGGAGLLAGIGALAIPGVGPVVAAGWLIATLTGAGVGAAAGGLIGALTGAGVATPDAETYHEGLRRGGHLVAVRTEESRVTEAEAILDRHGPAALVPPTRIGTAHGPEVRGGANDPILPLRGGVG